MKTIVATVRATGQKVIVNEIQAPYYIKTNKGAFRVEELINIKEI